MLGEEGKFPPGLTLTELHCNGVQEEPLRSGEEAMKGREANEAYRGMVN